MFPNFYVAHRIPGRLFSLEQSFFLGVFGLILVIGGLVGILLEKIGDYKLGHDFGFSGKYSEKVIQERIQERIRHDFGPSGKYSKEAIQERVRMAINESPRLKPEFDCNQTTTSSLLNK